MFSTFNLTNQLKVHLLRKTGQTQIENASVQTAKAIKKSIEKSYQLQVLVSPDLNPAENIQFHIKLIWKNLSTTHHLFEFINIEYNNIDSSLYK